MLCRTASAGLARSTGPLEDDWRVGIESHGSTAEGIGPDDHVFSNQRWQRNPTTLFLTTPRIAVELYTGGPNKSNWQSNRVPCKSTGFTSSASRVKRS